MKRLNDWINKNLPLILFLLAVILFIFAYWYTDGFPTINVTPESTLPEDDLDFCNTLENAEFISINQYEVGNTPNGPGIGYWYITLEQGNFHWLHSDVVERGTYVCRDNILRLNFSDREVIASYYGAREILIFDDVEYEKLRLSDYVR